MKVFIHQSALSRVESELAKLPVELTTIDFDGNVLHGGKKIELKDARPEVVWLSVDTFIRRQLPSFFEVALGSGTVKWMQSFSAGLDAPQFKAVVDKGIRLTNSDAQAIPIAEYVVANALAELHPIAAHRAAQKEKSWKHIGFREVSETTWLIVGFGHIGQEVAKRAKAFGAKIIGIRRSAPPHPLADHMGTLKDLLSFVPEADVIVLSCALNETTRDLASDAFFKAVKPGSILVNIARGPVIVDEALLAALDRNAPSVAVLDVFREEPLPASSPYWTHPKVRVTAHTSAAGSGTIKRGDRLFLDNLKRYAAGEKLINEIDPKAL
jgi:phosphoglycerate dehydrogenase-like enzyme